jgi:enoyl-CoA hydratase
MDNPPMNAMTPEVHTDLTRVFFDVNRDPDTAVVIITGAGDKAFSAGGNIKAMAERVERGDHASWLRSMREAKEIVYGLLRLEKPLIARINGHAMGLGATLAAYADFSYMMENASIADTHVKVGLTAGDGGALIWPFLVGFPRAKQYLLTGKAMDGREAARIGLVTESVGSIAELDKKTHEMAEELASGASFAINSTKMSINLILRKVLEGVIETHLGWETQSALTKDHLEAAIAFRDKRKPNFTGQ